MNERVCDLARCAHRPSITIVREMSVLSSFPDFLLRSSQHRSRLYYLSSNPGDRKHIPYLQLDPSAQSPDRGCRDPFLRGRS